MAISDLLRHPATEGLFPGATPALNSGQVAEMIGQQKDNRAKDLDYLMQQIDYSTKLKDVRLADLKRELESGAASFALEKQPDSLKRKYTVDTLNDEMAADEQLLRGINDPTTYARWGAMGMLPQTFHDKDGNPLPFEKTTKQRQDLVARGIMSAEQYRKERLAQIAASAAAAKNSFTAQDPTKQQVRMGAEAAAKGYDEGKVLGFGGWKISDSDKETMQNALAEVTAQVAGKMADSGVVPNETEIRQTLVDFARKAKGKNPNNKGIRRLVEDDEKIDWSKFNQLVNKRYQIPSYYGEGEDTGTVSVKGPAFMFKDKDGTEYTQDQLEKMAKDHNLTIDEVKEILNQD